MNMIKEEDEHSNQSKQESNDNKQNVQRLNISSDQSEHS